MQTDKQTDDLCLLHQRIVEQTKSWDIRQELANKQTNRRSLGPTPRTGELTNRLYTARGEGAQITISVVIPNVSTN